MGRAKVVMGLSGGMDSSTLLGYLLDLECEVHCCVFNYGSKHNKYENEAALRIAEYYEDRHYPVYVHRFDIANLLVESKSALMQTGEEIPEGHYNDENMRKTVVPGRNLIFISIMASLAECLKADFIHLGVHAGDHHIYPDCREDFIKAASQTVFLSTDGMVVVHAPFQRLDKRGILLTGFRFTPAVPYHLTRTCYKDQSLSCGKCGSCQERLEAFTLLNKVDPIPYEFDYLTRK